jgi:hypothetical protein
LTFGRDRRRALHGASIALILLATLVLGGCSGREPSQDELKQQVTALSTTLPLLQELGVTDFENSYCQGLVYRRGQFSSTPGTSCGIIDEGQPFDAQATADYAKLVAAFVATPVHVTSAGTNQGIPGGSDYDFRGTCSSCQVIRYNHQPGYHLPEDVPDHAHYIAVNPDWFVWDGPG